MIATLPHQHASSDGGPSGHYRQFANRRQVASYIGLAPSAYDSGESRRRPLRMKNFDYHFRRA